MPRENPHSGLLKIRRWQRDQSVALVQSTQQEIQFLVERIDALSESISQWSQARKALQAGLVKLQQWRENELYRSVLLDRKRTLVDQLDVLQVRLEQERAVLLEHEKELKQVQRLIAHAESALSLERLAAEQASLDEWSGVQASISRTIRP
ncbi:MAG: hypothetical protein NTV29_00695 [Planctomycetota bacterium]|jgi:flagellar export protein FliJ|nr:hypothetical protein [Planctomycetota bacterium]